MNNGKEYEEFVQSVQNIILQGYSELQNIKFERNVFLKGKSGVEREFDVVATYVYNNIPHTLIIECKDYKKKISLEKLDALQGKMLDFPKFEAMLVSKSGFQTGVLQKAAFYNVLILRIRKENEKKDWETEYGVPLMRDFYFINPITKKPIPISIAPETLGIIIDPIRKQKLRICVDGTVKPAYYRT